MSRRSSIFFKVRLFFALFAFLLLAVFLVLGLEHHFRQGGDFMRRIDQNYASLFVMAKNHPEGVVLESLEIELLSESERERLLGLKGHRVMEMAGRRILVKDEGWVRQVLIEDSERGGLALRDLRQASGFWLLGILFFLSILGIWGFYRAIMRSLLPLRLLERQILKFASGEIPEKSLWRGMDEVSRVGRAFHESALQVRALLDSREIFLRNAAHELKTPIAKGMVVAHMIENPRHKEWLLDIFLKMQSNLESIIMAEELSARELKPHMERLSLRQLCLEVREKLFLNERECVVEILPEVEMVCDRRLMHIALTNLIDNGLKFSTDHQVECAYFAGRVLIKNRGEALSEPIERYFEPFYKETSIRNERGSGLGLYLTKKVLEIQGLHLWYGYQKGKNIWAIGAEEKREEIECGKPSIKQSI